MSLQSILYSNPFKKETKEISDPPLAAIEKLFLYTIDQIADTSIAGQNFKTYREALGKIDPDDQIYSLIKIYLICESSVPDKSKLREDIRQKISLQSLDPRIRLIFLPDGEQPLMLYEYFIQPLAKYLIINLGKSRVERILVGQRAVPLVRDIIVAEDYFDFSIVNKKLSAKDPLTRKEVDDIFSFTFNLILTEISVLFGENASAALIKKEFDIIKSVYDYDIISSFLGVIPENDLENERLAFLSRDELEVKVHERTFLLKQEKERVDQKVKERTHELEDEKSKLGIITENMNEGAILFDENYRPVYINTCGKKILNIAPDNESLDTIPNAFIKKFQGVELGDSFERASRSGPFEVPEIDVENKVYKIVFTILNAGGIGKRALIWIEDITEPKMLERKKSEFVSVVAHQLRTPLSGIKWTLNMVITGDMGDISGEQKSFLTKAYESNDRMISLINDMLNVDRIVSGRLQYFFVNVQLLDLIDTVVYEVLPNARKKGVSIAFKEKPQTLPQLTVDPEKIRAVIQNLLENAIKYTKDKGVVIIQIVEKNDTIHVEIEDSGIGIPPAEQNSIFTRFFRGSNAVRVQTDGSGLGLFISKSIIEAHHGTIGFKSELGKGSTFYFDIPKQFTK